MQAFDHECELLAVEPHPFPYYSLHLRAPRAWSDLAAGQFVMVAAGDGLEPYLRRAFSVHDGKVAGELYSIELLAKIVGRGTRRLAGLRPGDRVAVLGPLGRPFSRVAEGPVALVAGGVGSAPLYLLGKQLLSRGVEFDFFYGGRSHIDLSRAEAFARLTSESGGAFVATTEDGSAGERGLVTEALERRIPTRGYRWLYACGPMGLLARLSTIAGASRIAGEAALETPMGCGYGACLGCAVPHVSGRFALCCKDGPVFRFDEVRW